MKINNDIVVFDLETTDDEADRRIIEVGAVLLDRDLNPRGTFSQLVYHGGPGLLSDYVKELTGLREGDFSGTKGWGRGEEGRYHGVQGDFLSWVEELVPNVRRVRLAAWGNYFDVNVLRAEYARSGIPYPWSGTCLDVKTAAALWCALSGRGTDKLGLQTVARHMGVEPDGPWHRALADAKVTAAVFKRAVTDLAGGVWLEERSGPYRRVEVMG